MKSLWDTRYSHTLTWTKEQTGSVNIGKMTTSLHTGTHVDAPYHFGDRVRKVHELDIEAYIGRARVIDVSVYDSIGREALAQMPIDSVSRLLLRTQGTPPYDPTAFPQQITYLRDDIGPFL